MPRMKSAAATATKRSMGKRINEDASERHGGKYKGGKAEWAIDVGCRPSHRVVHFTVACELISSSMEIISYNVSSFLPLVTLDIPNYSSTMERLMLCHREAAGKMARWHVLYRSDVSERRGVAGRQAASRVVPLIRKRRYKFCPF